MFPYTEKYIESESDIQNINLLYKIAENAKTISFFCFGKFGFVEENQKVQIVILCFI